GRAARGQADAGPLHPQGQGGQRRPPQGRTGAGRGGGGPAPRAGAPPAARGWREALGSAADVPDLVEVDADNDLALLQYTGGTTGVSKGVMLTHANLRANVEQVRAWFPDADPGREVMMAVLPFFHVYGLTVCLLLGLRLGAALVLLPRFDLDGVMSAVDKYRPTLFPGVPTMYVAINNAVEKGGHDLSSINARLAGAAAPPLEVAQRL